MRTNPQTLRKYLGHFARDVGHAIRLFRKRPVLAAAIIGTLALAVGANTAIFSVVNAMLLKPLTLPTSERLVFVTGWSEGRHVFLSFPDFEDVRRDARSFVTMTAFRPQSVNLTGREEPLRIVGGFVSDTFFDVMGVHPAQGRGFRPGEDEESAVGVCVLDHAAWQRLFGGKDMLGNTLILNNKPFTVIGILPPAFRYAEDNIEVWIPHHNQPAFAEYRQDRATPLVRPIARLKPGVTLEAARAELDGIGARLARAFPEAGADRGPRIRRFQDVLAEPLRPMLLLLQGAVALVLLIACANVGGLLLSLGASRGHEMATRAALGASRGRLVGQLLTETLLLWSMGTTGGLLLGPWLRDLLMTIAPAETPVGFDVSLDLNVLGITLGLSLVLGLLCGLAPALRLSRPDLVDDLREGGRTGGGEIRPRLRAALVAGQVALALVLLTAAGLLQRSFQKLTTVELGYRPQGLLTMEYRLPRNKYPQEAQQWLFHRQVIERVSQLPGVRSASAINGLPFSGNYASVEFERPDGPPNPQARLRGQLNTVGPRLFETMGIPLLRGRSFVPDDKAEAPLVAVVNHQAAERFWPGEDPVGHSLRVVDELPLVATIVGVVGNVKFNGLDDVDDVQVYVPQAQNPTIFNTLVVRTGGDPLTLATAVRGAVWSVDKDQPVWKVRTADSLVDRWLTTPRFLVRLMSAYSFLALALAALGLYALVAFAVERATREIGVRMALGARPADVLWLVLRGSLVLAGLGVAAGLAASLWAGRLLHSLLFGVSTSDPATLAGVVVLLLAVSLLAAYVPARRAARVDPLVALRTE
jgi:putative ABC transport system permease protein